MSFATSSRAFLRNSLLAVAPAALLVVACSGSHDLSLGESSSSETTACPPAKCTELIACAEGTPTNVRCVTDPNAGKGSVAADACVKRFDCTAPGGDAGQPRGDAAVPGADAAVPADPCVPKGGSCTSTVCAGSDRHIDTAVTCPANQWCCVPN